jgi:hypothetical protein
MSGIRLSARFASVVLLIGMLVLPTSGVSAAASGDTSFSGQATVIQVSDPLTGPVVLADTGPLSASGGARDASLLNAAVPGVVTAEVLHATTIGQGDRSRSEASVADVAVTLAGHSVTAEFLMSRATAVCSTGGPSAHGESEIVGLAVDNQSVVVSGQPNQTVTLPANSGAIVINEQSSTRRGDVTVNALHVTANSPVGKVDVIVASAHADITCPPPGQATCPGSDFTTGGGWIVTSSGAKGSLAVAGGVKQNGLWGHLQYIDHGAGPKVKGTGVTAYTITGPTSRRIEGTADIDGAPGTYTVDVADNGEPGRGVDTFTITLSNGYTAGGPLAGGNIQLHKPCS